MLHKLHSVAISNRKGKGLCGKNETVPLGDRSHHGNSFCSALKGKERMTCMGEQNGTVASKQAPSAIQTFVRKCKPLVPNFAQYAILSEVFI